MTRGHLKDNVVYQFVRGFGWFCRRISKRYAMHLGTGIGRCAYRLWKRRRQIALNNLQLAFGAELTEAQRHDICKASFINVGKTCIEFLRFPQFTVENIWRDVTVEGAENLHNALSRGKGAIVFLPHFGNWELLALVYGALIPHQAKAIAFPLKNERLNAYVWRYREHLSLELIPRRRAVRETLQALKRNHAVGFFADQGAGASGVPVNFFGKPASAARGPVVFALKTGAPLLFSINIRQPDERHHVHILPPITLEPTTNFEQDVHKWTTHLLMQLETYIRKSPEQWLWLHNRWKTVPSPSPKRQKPFSRV